LPAMMEGDTVTVTMPATVTLESAAATTLPKLNAGYVFDGPTTTPSLPQNAGDNDGHTITILYGIKPLQSLGPTKPIPTLDLRGLLLLIGMLSGLALWWSRRRPAGPRHGRS